MPVTAVRKNKINLEDYDYQADIDQRLRLSNLSQWEVDALQEILDGSITFSLSTLAEHVQCDKERLTPLMTKLEGGLLKLVGDKATVNKERRRFYESQIAKFDPQFEPGIAYLKGQLSKVPLATLMQWYPISKSTDNIIDAIIESVFCTPKTYLAYLKEWDPSDPLLQKMVKDIWAAPDYQISADALQAKHNLSRPALVKALLMLEFHLVATLSYRQEGEKWVEVVTPFHEWRSYLLFHKKTTPCPIPVGDVTHKSGDPFTYIQSVASLVKSATTNPVMLDVKNEPLAYRAALLGIGQITDHKLHATARTAPFLAQSVEDQAIFLYRHPRNRVVHPSISKELSEDATVYRAIEATLKKHAKAGWILFSEYLQGLESAVGTQKAVALVKGRGSRYSYALPSYTADERLFIELVVLHRLNEVGMIETGRRGSDKCFRVTDFGRSILGV